MFTIVFFAAVWVSIAIHLMSPTSQAAALAQKPNGNVWVDEDTQYLCAMGDRGLYLVGYVEVPEYHPWYGEPYEKLIMVDVPWIQDMPNLSFSGHKPYGKGWFFGFDYPSDFATKDDIKESCKHLASILHQESDPLSNHILKLSQDD